MKRFFLYSIIFLIYSCDEKEILIEIEPIEIKDRETLLEINEVMAFLDVERIGEDSETGFAFMLEFQDSQGPKYLHVSEDPIIGVFFHDSLIFGDPIDIPGAKSFEIRTEVSILPSLLLSVYSLEEGKIKISRALNPGWMPPKPPTVSTNNFLNLTVDIKNKYDSLDLILRIPNEIEYSITQNTLLLYNPVTQIRARFFLP